MKVLHINCNYIGTRLHREMVEHLNEFAVESTVYVPVCEKEKEDVTTKNCEVVVSKCFQKWHRILFDYKQSRIVRDIQEKIDCGGYDCIHAYTLFTDGNCARRIGRKYHIPYVVAVRDTDVNVFLKKAAYLRGRAVKILRDASAVFFLSENYQKQVLEQYVPDRFRQEIYAKSYIVPNGVNDFWLENCYKDKPNNPKLAEKVMRVLCVGVVNNRKNQLTTQKALQLLRKQGWTVHFQIVGKVLNEELFEQIMSYPDTEYIPPQPQQKLLDYYRQNDLLVMPSKTETFGLVYVEALSQGLPVIYTKGQGFDGQFEDGVVGYAVDAANPADIAQKILDVVERYQELCQQGLEGVSAFNWKDICAKYKVIYEKILADKVLR